MARRRASEKREYLARNARHAALLQAALAVVEAGGWPALTMVAVAERANVSRQLVYEHFGSLDRLVTEAMTAVLREMHEGVGRLGHEPRDLADVSRFAERMTFALSSGRARALGEMITAASTGTTQARRMSRRLRQRLTNLWAPAARDAFARPERESRALTWMLHLAFWGARQLVDDGEIDGETARRLFVWMVSRLRSPRPR